MEPELRTFSVRTGGGHNQHPIQARDAEEAALAFADRWCPDADDEVTLHVTDCDSGREQCLVLDLHSGEARAC